MNEKPLKLGSVMKEIAIGFKGKDIPSNEDERYKILDILKVVQGDIRERNDLYEKLQSLRMELLDDQEISFNRYVRDITRLIHNNGFREGAEA